MELDDAKKDMDDAKTVGSRIRDLRNALGYPSATDFARTIGSTPQALSNWERAFKRIGLDEAWKIRCATGVTLDWIYSGDDSLIQHGVALKLAAYREANAKADAS
jgi:transcriptional regulator with XRE-family HTH domain